MSEELVTQEQQSTSVEVYDPKNAVAFDVALSDQLLDDSSFYAWLQLCSSKSDVCVSGKVPVNNYVVFKGKDNPAIIGPECHVVPYGLRWKAINAKSDPKLITFDPTSKLAASIRALSGNFENKCTHGPEFLLWVTDIKVWATFHLVSESAKKIGKTMQRLMGQHSTMGMYMAKNSKGTWMAPNIAGCSLPFEQPSDLMAQVNKFKEQAIANVEPEKAPETGREV